MTMIAPVSTAATAAPSAIASPASSDGRYGFGDDGFTFGDFLDIINPLQHIPVVGTIYRAITGDEMAPASEIAGGALFGGPIGALLSVADVAFADATGKPIDETMLAWIGIGGDAKPTAVAQNVAVQTPMARGAMPSRIFPAATTRIVPMANYTHAQTPMPAAPSAPAMPARPSAPAASAAPANFVLPQPSPAGATPAASTAPAPVPATTAATQPDLQGAEALLAALRDSGVDPTSAARAAAAYQASLTLQSPLALAPAPAETEADRR